MHRDQLDQLTVLDLKFLLELSELKSITKAGARLNLSPSKASRTMRRLREMLSDELVSVTQTGAVFTNYFERILPVVEEVLEKFGELSRRTFDPAVTTRTFRLTCVMAEAAHILGGVMPLMLKEAPRARLDLCKNEDEFSGILNGYSDFAIVTGIDLPPSVHFLRLYRIDRVILLREDHPLVRLDRPLKTEDLMDFGRVTIRTGRTDAWTGPDQNIFPAERYMEHTRLSTTRLNVGWEAMQNTDLISVCGWRAAEIAMRAYRLRTLPLPEDCKASNPWTVLIWPDFSHHEPGCIWLRGIFSRWAKMEAERTQRLVREGKGPPSGTSKF